MILKLERSVRSRTGSHAKPFLILNFSFIFMPATVDYLRELVYFSLRNANRKLTGLGGAGREELETPNRFGEIPIRADVECESAVITHLTGAGIGIRLFTEEQKNRITDIGDESDFEFFGVLDGVDGSTAYKEDPHARCGTMFAIFEGPDPKFEDYLVSGIVDHYSGSVLLGAKGKGVIRRGIVENPNSFSESEVTRSNQITLLNQLRTGYIDEGFEFNTEAFAAVKREAPSKSIQYLRSSAAYYYDFAAGRAQLVLECTRQPVKDSLEIAVAYPLVHESGGVMVGPAGRDIGPQKVLEFGQEGHVPVISACTMDLASSTLARVPRDYRNV